MNQRDPGWRAGMRVAALDPYRRYASALRTTLPHTVRWTPSTWYGWALLPLTTCGPRIQQAQTGHRGRQDDPLYRIRRLLRRSHDHHSEHSWLRVLAGLDGGDTDDEQLARTWVAAHDLR
jgi:transposase